MSHTSTSNQESARSRYLVGVALAAMFLLVAAIGVRQRVESDLAVVSAQRVATASEPAGAAHAEGVQPQVEFVADEVLGAIADAGLGQRGRASVERLRLVERDVEAASMSATTTPDSGEAAPAPQAASVPTVVAAATPIPTPPAPATTSTPVIPATATPVPPVPTAAPAPEPSPPQPTVPALPPASAAAAPAAPATPAPAPAAAPAPAPATPAPAVAAAPAAPATPAPAPAAAPTPPPVVATAVPVVSNAAVPAGGPDNVVRHIPASAWRWLDAYGWTVDWRQGPGPGRISEAQYATSTIVIWYDTSRSDATWAGAFAHELGHAVSFVHFSTQQMNDWNALRGISSWRWVPGTPNDFSVGEGDFAEAFMSYLLGHQIRSVGGPLSAADRAWIAANTPF